VVIGSGDFLNDTVFQISSQLSAERYLNSLQLVQNSVDWSAEDLDLLQIRARGTRARVLEPIPAADQTFWEFANYAVAFISLLLIAGIWALRRRSEKPMQLSDVYAPSPDAQSNLNKSDAEVSLERV
jgi:ABC-2 type transport system permease protein